MPRAIAAVSIAAIFLTVGCQGGESNDGRSVKPSAAEVTCDKIMSAQAKAAMKRIADIPDSAKVAYLGNPQGAADDLVALYDTGTASEWDEVDFCGAHKGSEGLGSVQVRFALADKLPEEGNVASIFKKYSMAKAALAGVKVGVLYFECSSKNFASGAGATVLVRGEVRSRYETSEPEEAAREDALRIVYESSRAVADLLACKSNAGLPGSFTMPPEV
ncbi:hypothetical protein [Streptomyces regalis]|uniref:hypothetical protein n=1 Tax=Streptomyces regalis TaxID=68262 RepID=UPI00131CAA0B|nr:hypothetical protein [Streptomyces regalis]